MQKMGTVVSKLEGTRRPVGRKRLSNREEGIQTHAIEIELNEALMDITRESIKNMPQAGGMMRKMIHRRSKEGE